MPDRSGSLAHPPAGGEVGRGAALDAGAVTTPTQAGYGARSVVDLASARDPRLVGHKAARLAEARRRDLPVLDGFVITVASATGGRPGHAFPHALRRHWERLSRGGHRALVVRSSSPLEDDGASSMAGRFTSVLGVRGWDSFLRAVGDVIASASAVSGNGHPPPMAVLVQPHLEARRGGVMFGLDPVTGARRVVVEATEGGPDRLVSGPTPAARYVLGWHGRAVEVAGESPGLLDRRHRRHLARLVRTLDDVFDGPQDVEWAFDGDDRLWLLQSRPVTAAPTSDRPVGPVLGPGPVSETFPFPLRRLEVDLWVEPLREGVVEALRVVGSASRRRLASSPIVTAVNGRVAADLQLLGVERPRRSRLGRLDPRPGARRLLAAWRVGRLRVALPLLAADLVQRIDRDLESVPELATLSDVEVVGVLRASRAALRSLHGYEVLAGMLLRPGADAPTAVELGLRAVTAGRVARRSDAEVIATRPVALAVVAPRVGGRPTLPEPVSLPHRERAAVADLEPREALRLRARWVQELAARAATELGCRLSDTGRVPAPDAVAHLRLNELEALVAGAPVPGDLPERAQALPGPPLPARFRLSPGGRVVGLDAGRGGGQGAGGGRGAGLVRHEGDGAPRPGDVLVVRSLAPGLAATLPVLAGLVAETGAVLSHLAILARELGVPTVVGVPDALRRFPAGATLLVDGTTGEVTRVAEDR